MFSEDWVLMEILVCISSKNRKLRGVKAEDFDPTGEYQQEPCCDLKFTFAIF